MNIQKRIAAGIVFSLFILFAATGGFAAEGKVSMDQWLKIINPVSPKEAPPRANRQKDGHGCRGASETPGYTGYRRYHLLAYGG